MEVSSQDTNKKNFPTVKPERKKGRKEMTIKQILETGLIKDNTEVWIRQGDGFHVLAHGNWYQDDILEHMNREVESFTWQDDNNFYIDVK